MKTKGAKSHSLVTLAELNQKLNKNEEVVVSRRWAKTRGLVTNEAPKTVTPTAKADGEISVQFVN